MSAITLPSDTITFGEKCNDSYHTFMDTFQGSDGNDGLQLEHSRHMSQRSNSGSGGSNYAMADGSARFIRFPGGIHPDNLWAVVDFYRHNYLPALP